MSVIHPCTVPAQSLSAISGRGWSLWLMVLGTQWTQARIYLKKRKEKLCVKCGSILLRTLTSSNIYKLGVN